MSTPLEQALQAVYPHLQVLSQGAPLPGALRGAHEYCSAFLDHPLAIACSEALLCTTGPGIDGHARMYALQILSRAVSKRGGNGEPDLQALMQRLLSPGGALMASSPPFVAPVLASSVAGLLEREFPQRWPDGLQMLTRLIGEYLSAGPMGLDVASM